MSNLKRIKLTLQQLQKAGHDIALERTIRGWRITNQSQSINLSIPMRPIQMIEWLNAYQHGYDAGYDKGFHAEEGQI